MKLSIVSSPDLTVIIDAVYYYTADVQSVGSYKILGVHLDPLGCWVANECQSGKILFISNYPHSLLCLFLQCHNTASPFKFGNNVTKRYPFLGKPIYYHFSQI